MYRVVRTTHDTQAHIYAGALHAHASERLQKQLPVPHEIANAGTLGELWAKVDELVNSK
jgi:hypothetical protein